MYFYQNIDLDCSLEQVYFVGDCHGRYDLLRNAMLKAGFNEQRGDILIATGDLIDGGWQDEACLALLDQPWFYSVLGNHDEFLLKYGEMPQAQYEAIGEWLIEEEGIAKLKAWRDDPCVVPVSQLHPMLTSAVAHWILNHGAWWFCAPRAGGWAKRQDLLQHIKQKHLPLLMRLTVAGKRFGVVHAGLKGRVWPSHVDQISKHTAECYLWDRDGFECAVTACKDAAGFAVSGVDAVVMGHNIVQRDILLQEGTPALFRGNQCYLDVGAKAGIEPCVLRADALLTYINKGA